MSFFETSVKTNQNIKEVFYFLTQEILKVNKGQDLGGNVKLKKSDGKEGGKNECSK